jgi:hypothetical protein
MVAVTLIQCVRKVGDLSSVPFVNQLEEYLLLIVLPYSFRGLRNIRSLGIWGSVSLYSFSAYLALGLVSSAGSGVPFAARALQFALEMKYPIVALAFLGAGRTIWLWDRFSILAAALLFVSVPVTLFQFISPSAYDAVFSSGAGGIFRTSSGGALPRAAGVFWFTGQLAVFSAIMAAYFTLRASFQRGALLWFPGVTALLLLAASLSTQEITGFVVLLPLCLFLVHRSSFVGEKYVLCVVTIPLAVLLGYQLLSTYVVETAAFLGLADIETSTAARVVFYWYGFILANLHFPLGAGLGSFGGAAANIFDSTLYSSLGFGMYSWYRNGVFMTDTFWPHVMGEAGWLGLAAYLLSLGGLATASFRNARIYKISTESKYLGMMCLFGVLYGISNSITAPNLTSLFDLMLSFGFLGVLVPTEQIDPPTGRPAVVDEDRPIAKPQVAPCDGAAPDNSPMPAA